MEVINWHSLPCLIVDDKAVVFSKVKNKMVAALVPVSSLSNEATLSSLHHAGMFTWINENRQFYETKVKLLTLCLTERCNCHCRYCFLDANSDGKVMTIRQLKAAIRFAFERYAGNTVVISAFGGEPCTEPGLIEEMIRFSKEIKDQYQITSLRYAITTNGVISSNLLHTLAENKFEVSISFDGNEDVQNFHRPLANGSATFESVVHTIQFLVKQKIPVRVRATVTRFSVNQMPDFVRFLGKLGVSMVHFEPITEGGRAVTSDERLQKPNVELYAKKLLECIEIGKRYHVDINCSPFVRCDGTIKSRLVIGANGMISSCIEVQNEKHVLADYFGMGKVYEDGKYVIFHNTTRQYGEKSEVRPECNTCPYQLFCMNSCPVRNIRSTGCSWITDDFKCKLLKLVMPTILHKFYVSTFFKQESYSDSNITPIHEEINNE